MIQHTSNYDQFQFIKGNRACEDYQRLLDSIKRRNMLPFHPIHVDKNYKIIDGQHRYRAAKELGLDVFFIVDEKANPGDIIDLNVYQKNWNTKNFLDFHCEHKLKEYVFFRNIKDKYNFEVSDMIANFTCEGHLKARVKSFQKGFLQFSATHEEIEKYCQMIAEIKNCFKKITKKRLKYGTLFSSLCSLIRMNGYDHKNFIYKIKNFPEGLEVALNCRTQSAIKNKLIELVYNYRTTANSAKRLPVDSQ